MHSCTANLIRFLVILALAGLLTACGVPVVQEPQPSALVAVSAATLSPELAAPSPAAAPTEPLPFSVEATLAPSPTRPPATVVPVPLTPVATARPDRLPATPLPPTATQQPPTATPEAPVITLRANANLRSGPGVVYPVIGGSRQGQVLTVFGQYAGWWQTPRGWVSGALAQPNAAASAPGGVPVVQTVPAPPTSTPQPPATATLEAAVTPAQAALAPLAGLPAYQDVVVLGPDTVYPVRARVVKGWGYELVDASAQYDWLIKRDVYGAVAHQFWGDRLYRKHPAGIRITLLDAVYEPDCQSAYCAPQVPVPLTNFRRNDYELFIGYGDGEGSMIWHGCAIEHLVHYDPQECFIAVAAPGPHLTDVVVSSTITAYGAERNKTPDFTLAPFTPLLGQAHHSEGQWRWADPYLEVIRVQ